MKYKLLAIDLDGTLLDDKQQVSPRNIAALRSAAKSGAHVMIATGRPYLASQWVFEKSGLEGLIMSLGGALVSRYPSGETVSSEVLSSDVPLEIARFCRERGVFFHCISGTEYYFEKQCPEVEVTEHYFGFKGHCRTFDENEEIVFNKGNLVLLDPAMTQQIADALDMALVGKAEVLVSDKQVIDITPKGVNKAVTLLKVAESLGVSPEEIMAFGDTSSDISMIKAAGIGVCTANGTPDALAVADLIAPSNNDDGVADIIERYVLV